MTDLLAAFHFAAERHRDQRRKGADRAPYINHAIEVAALLAGVAGVKDDGILIAAVLHDTVEDTRTTPDEIEAAFGPTVRRIVQEVTDDKRLPKPERKRLQIEHAPRLSPAAKLVKIADKISNVREVTDNPPSGWPLERRRDYVEWAERVVTGCRGVSSALESRFDEVAARARAMLANDA